MGIANLLPMFRSSMIAFDPAKFSGHRCAIDGYGWIHVAIRSCGQQLIKYANEPCDVYLHNLMQKIQVLLQNNIDVTVVFDGRPVPAKQDTQLGRRQNRQSKLALALEADAAGDVELANKNYNLAVGVTHRIVANWIYLLQKVGCKFVVAPYEADAQLAFLARSGAVDFVITEDSDLILYECPCIVFKFDRTGNGDLFWLSSLQHFTDDHLPMTPYILRQACILSKCDYFEGIPGLGLKGALKLVNAHSSIMDAIQYFAKSKQMNNVESIVSGYLLAESTFLHQVILNNNSQCMHLSEALGNTRCSEKLEHVGTIPYTDEPETMRAICVLGVADVQSGFIPCKSDFEALQGMCAVCKLRQDCACTRVEPHIWYRDALLCQASYEYIFKFDPTKRLPPDMAPKAPAVKFAQCKYVAPRNYKKRKVQYVSDSDEEFPSPPQ